MNLINLNQLIAVTSIQSNSDGVVDWQLFRLIFPYMVVEVRQYIRKSDPHESFKYIQSVREKAINSLKWWRRMFPTPLNVSGLCIKCYIPQHRKNDY